VEAAPRGPPGPPLSSAERDFEARDLIEVMEEAVRYNRFLISELARWAEGLRSVLDFGAGNGRFALALRERGVEVTAIEPDPLLAESIRARGVPAVAGLEALAEGRVDGVYSINVLEHLEDDRAVLGAFRGRLGSGGRLFLYVPAFPILFSANDARVGHLRRYRRRELVARVREAGFAVESARHVDSLGFAAGLGYRLFGRRDGGLDPAKVRLYDALVFPVSRRLDLLCDRFVGKNLLLRARAL
jgi:SAM-dependent methyltransferase